MIGQLIIKDMLPNLDPAQFANQKGISLQHYLVQMIDRILTDTDSSTKGEANAVIATLYDWKEAFPRQDPKLGVEAFIRCGVRPALIPLLTSYFQERTMVVKWKGVTSSERKLNGGGPQGSLFGNWEYLGQSNENAECVDEGYKFKFVDDLSVLEKINLLLIGLASHNYKSTVANDVSLSGQIISAEHLKSQYYLDSIQNWTRNQKMILNDQKTKVMIFNFTENHQFSTRLKLNDEKLEVVKQAKLLGLILTDDLKWDENTHYLVKRAYARMQILRKASTFTNNISDLRTIYIMYIRSILEQNCVVWHSNLSEKNTVKLERVQKVAVRIIVGNYEDYGKALEKLDLEPLSDRRVELCKKFAIKCTENQKMKEMFPLKQKAHDKNLRKEEKYVVKHARTDRLRKSAIPFMQRLLNAS